MQHKLELLGNDTIVVSPTQLEIIRTCARMWDYRYLYRRVEAEVDAAKAGGKAVDEAFNYRYRMLGNKPVTPEVEAVMLAMIDAAYEGVDLPLEEFRTPARYKEVIQAYNAHWKQEPFEVLGVQVPFALLVGTVDVGADFWTAYYTQLGEPIPNDLYRCKGGMSVKVVVRGLIDTFVRAANHVLIADTKTSKDSIGQSYENSAQMKCYMWAMQQLATLHPEAGLPPVVHGAFINGVTIRPPYKREDRKPSASDKPRNAFERTFPTFYTPERLEEWRLDTLLHVETALGWVARDHFPQNERACTFHMDAAFKNYGHYGKPCPYLKVCQLPRAQRPMALASDEFMDYERGPLAAPAVEVPS